MSKENILNEITELYENRTYLDFQEKILLHLKNIEAPDIIKNSEEDFITSFKDKTGKNYSIRLLSWISGRVWSTVNPITGLLRESLGERCGQITEKLKSFNHKYSRRHSEWDLSQMCNVSNVNAVFSNCRNVTHQNIA